ncbi:MAG: aminoglycoside phosphotransferase family protein [Actinomycetota bacterium]
MPVEELLTRWQLTLGEEYPPGAAGRAWRATCGDGTPAVLKLGLPHRESEHEAAALARWDGDGAVRLLAHEGDWILMERAEPGTPLTSRTTEEAMDVLCGLLPRLWKPADGFTPLADEVEFWQECGDLDEETLAIARELAASQGELVLTSQDLHGGNVLAAEREPWLAIDPKPLAAEREFQAAPIVRAPEFGHSKAQALYRLDRLAELGLDRERARLWTIVQTVAWSESRTIRSHVDTIEWLT